MARAMQRLEALDRFSNYLSFAIPGYTSPGTTRNPDLLAHSHLDSQDHAHDSGDNHELNSSTCLAKPYSIPQNPSFHAIPVAALCDIYGATDFSMALDTFLKDPAIDLHPGSQYWNMSAVFEVYKRITLTLPYLPLCASESCHDVIRATPKIPANGHRKEVPAHFDTALAWHNISPGGPVPTRPKSIFELIAVRVRVIFKLPPELAKGNLPHPLAFVEYFTPFNPNDIASNSPFGLLRVKKSSRNHRQSVGIIPVTHLYQSCHLIPDGQVRIPADWDMGNVLDKCNHFFLNSYLRHHDFALLKGLY